MTGTGRRHGLEGSWDWLEYAAGLPSKPISVPVGSAAGLVMGGRAVLTGGWFGNSGTVAGHISVYDGADGNGLEVARVALPASGVAVMSLPSRGLLLDIGCWVSVSTGTLGGTLYLIPLWHYPMTAPGE